MKQASAAGLDHDEHKLLLNHTYYNSPHSPFCQIPFAQLPEGLFQSSGRLLARFRAKLLDKKELFK
jgi:hypothetical protein